MSQLTAPPIYYNPNQDQPPDPFTYVSPYKTVPRKRRPGDYDPQAAMELQQRTALTQQRDEPNVAGREQVRIDRTMSSPGMSWLGAVPPGTMPGLENSYSDAINTQNDINDARRRNITLPQLMRMRDQRRLAVTMYRFSPQGQAAGLNAARIGYFNSQANTRDSQATLNDARTMDLMDPTPPAPKTSTPLDPTVAALNQAKTDAIKAGVQNQITAQERKTNRLTDTDHKRYLADASLFAELTKARTAAPLNERAVLDEQMTPMRQRMADYWSRVKQEQDQPQGQQQPANPAIPQHDIEILRQHADDPTHIQLFNKHYGDGAAENILGLNK